MSRVTKAMKARRRVRRWHPPRKRATHVGGRTVVFGPGRLSINGVPLGVLTTVSVDFASVRP
jgi:hypothetical protein